ncbi:ABC transporter permease [Labilibacter marinus]|uniref:ABC transporter permease n=1 Tax=Labilibacter marinus TaxID=1477105 RepID=UPI000835AAE5|nr:ABC transporter permease [Labilibacter marinus]
MEQIYTYIKVALRSLVKFRSDAILNVIGLSVGITISLVVFMYVRYELGYDKNYSKSENTYRIITTGNISGSSFNSALSPKPLAGFLKNNFQEVEVSTRLVRGSNKLISHGDKKFNEAEFFYADSSFFKVFDVPIIQGKPINPLESDEDVVITSVIAKKYFGGEDPIGKKIELDNGLSFYVTAVCEPQAPNSHFNFDFVASEKSINKLYIEKKNWLKIDWYTYLTLKPSVSSEHIEGRLNQELKKKIKNKIQDSQEKSAGNNHNIKALSFHLQPLESIHLHSQLDDELKTNSKHLYVKIFLYLAIFVLLITCINFINLTTARASLRIKEIGVRKLIGGHRNSLMLQFLVEAITYSFVALFIGLVLVELLLPGFNILFDLNLKLNRSESRIDLLYILVVTFLIGIISGLYPAIAFSRINEVQIFKDGFQPKKKGLIIRGILAATQVMVATFLIIFTLGMLWQIQFLRNKDLGFDSKNIIVVERGYSLEKKFGEFKSHIKLIPGVENVSACLVLPGEKASQESFTYTGKDGDKMVLMPFNYIEKDFFKTLGLKLEAGGIWNGETKKFSPDLLINSSAKEELGFTKALGTELQFTSHSKQLTIKGVFKDFHFEPIQFPIRPLILMDIPKNIYYSNLLIKINDADKFNNIIGQVREDWRAYTNNEPFEYRMLEDVLENNLHEENVVFKIIMVFMVLSLLIAWLGIRAFTAFVDEMKQKEFISKKIIGASPIQIFNELFLSVSQYILPGILLAIPTAFSILSLWLNGFAYYSRFPVLLMVAIAGIVWGLSFLLILLHSGKSIRSNPTHIS